jgi:hypothetical protein
MAIFSFSEQRRKMNKQTKTKIKRDKGGEKALMRYDIISRAVNNSFEEYSREEFFAVQASKEHYFNGVIVHASAATLKRWYLAYKKDGLEALYPKARRDEEIRSKVSEQIGERIKQFLEEHPRWTNEQLYLTLINDAVIEEDSFSISTFARYVKNNKLRTPILPKFEKRSFISEEINDIWEGDSTFGLTIEIDGKLISLVIIGFIDNKSSFIVSCRIYRRDNAFAVIDVVKHGVLKYGIPKKIYVDNGKPYVSKQLLQICAKCGMIHIRTAPYTPTAKGAIERFWRTLKSKWLHIVDLTQFHSIEEAQESLDQFIHNYNHSVHSTIKKTPFEVFQAEKSKIRYLPVEKITTAFMCFVVRLVNNVGCVKFKNNEYEVPAIFVGCYIEIYFEEGVTDYVYVYMDKQLTKCYKVNREANANAHRSGIKF